MQYVIFGKKMRELLYEKLNDDEKSKTITTTIETTLGDPVK